MKDTPVSWLRFGAAFLRSPKYKTTIPSGTLNSFEKLFKLTFRRRRLAADHGG
jgi:hypothetical protein